MKVEIDTEQIWSVIENLLTFPHPTVCRHYVIGIVVSRLFEDNNLYEGNSTYDEFCKHALRSMDDEAIVHMDKIRNQDAKFLNKRRSNGRL
jgi:hypothetical protein